MGDFGVFPRNLAYSIKSLSGFSKQTVKILPDRSDVNQSETIKFKLPVNSLIDLRTICIYWEGTCTTANTHFPRLSSSLIESLAVYFNSTQIDNIQGYNLLYNTLFDIQGAGVDQLQKRSLENIDPSLKYTAIDGDGYITVAKNSGSTVKDTCHKMVVNNFLGILGQNSSPVIDSSDIGDIWVEIRLAPASVLYGSAPTTAGTVANPTGYSLTNIRMTCSRISFNNPDYYELKAGKLVSDGLSIGFNTYVQKRGSSTAKASGITHTFSENANSLDQIIATFQESDYSTTDATAKTALLNFAGADLIANNKPFATMVTDPSAYTQSATANTTGDAFNQSRYFKRNAIGLTGSKFTINSVQMNPYPLPIEEVFQETLISMGNLNNDLYSGLHSGILSIFHFMKYYFVHILSLEYLAGDGQFWKSGLDGRASSITIVWETTFNTALTYVPANLIPVVYCRRTNIVTILEGHQVMVQ